MKSTYFKEIEIVMCKQIMPVNDIDNIVKGTIS